MQFNQPCRRRANLFSISPPPQPGKRAVPQKGAARLCVSLTNRHLFDPRHAGEIDPDILGGPGCDRPGENR